MQGKGLRNPNHPIYLFETKILVALTNTSVTHNPMRKLSLDQSNSDVTFRETSID